MERAQNESETPICSINLCAVLASPVRSFTQKWQGGAGRAPARGKGTSARKPYLKEIADMALASGLFIFAVKQVSCKVHKSSISRIVKKNQGVSVFINEYDFHVHAQLACGVLV